jgi:hypothetical protein
MQNKLPEIGKNVGEVADPASGLITATCGIIQMVLKTSVVRRK